MSKARQLADLNATSLADLSDNSISGAFEVGSLSVGGTEVIDSSRNLTNIAGGFKTVNGTSVVGSGDISAGASTTFGDVGTYIRGRPANSTNYAANATASGLRTMSAYDSGVDYWYASIFYGCSTTSVSGTWRHMGGAGSNGTFSRAGIWVRIS